MKGIRKIGLQEYFSPSSTSGMILHLDGDRKYAEKSKKFYKQFSLNSIVFNISESKQPLLVCDLVLKYSPDILVITGHDAMIKANSNFYNLHNYKNSKYFTQTVIEARKIRPSSNHLTIIAGACQSFFESLIRAGANFASSPARILVDFKDPLLIAKKVATTPQTEYVSINDISNNLRDGKRGFDGIGSMGKLRM